MIQFKFSFNPNDPLGLHRRYSVTQCHLDPGTATVIGASIAGGSSLLGGAIGGSGGGSIEAMSTLSRSQKGLDTVLIDFLLGIERDAKGNIISKNPLLTRAYNKAMPQYKAMPMTDNQQSGLAAAKNLLGQIQNPVRPDAGYMKDLAHGILPGKTKSAALGAALLPGEKAVVGEDGPEVIEVQPDGSVKVIPNPKSVASPKAIDGALAKSEAVQQDLGVAKGMAVGGMTLTSDAKKQRKWGDYYIPDSAPGMDTGLAQYKDQDWYEDVVGDYNTIWGGTDSGKDWTRKLERSKLWTGDMSEFPIQKETHMGMRDWHNKKYKGALEDYYTGLDEYWNGLEQTTENAGVSESLSGLPSDQYEGFYDWWNSSSNVDVANPLGTRDGALTFEDPFSVDGGKLRDAIPQYWEDSGYAQNEAGEWVEKNNWSDLSGHVNPEQYTAFNEFSAAHPEWGGAQINTGPNGAEFGSWQNGQWVPADDTVYQGATQAIKQYQAEIQASRPHGEGLGEESPTETTPTGVDPAAIATAPVSALPVASTGDDATDTTLSAIGDALAENSKSFDADAANDTFNKSIYNPAMSQFEKITVPGIQETFAGGNLFGSARDKAVLSERGDLNESLNSDRATYVANSEQAHKNRALSAVSLTMDLAKLPGTIAGQAADNDYKVAAAASTFANIETQNALVNSQITNDQLVGIVTLQQMFDTEQYQEQAEWNAAMQNALQADGGLDWTSIIQIMMGYNSETQLAFATS